jgi:hypothetical protein
MYWHSGTWERNLASLGDFRRCVGWWIWMKNETRHCGKHQNLNEIRICDCGSTRNDWLVRNTSLEYLGATPVFTGPKGTWVMQAICRKV